MECFDLIKKKKKLRAIERSGGSLGGDAVIRNEPFDFAGALQIFLKSGILFFLRNVFGNKRKRGLELEGWWRTARWRFDSKRTISKGALQIFFETGIFVSKKKSFSLALKEVVWT